jgi:fatty-acyl-CoA synthase
VIMRSWDPEEAIDLIAEHQVTMVLGVPTIFLTISQSPRWGTADFSSVRSLPCGAAPLPRSLIETYLERGMTFLQGYGMTESSPNATFLRADRSVDKLGSAGTPCFFTDLRIADLSGAELPAGHKGEVQIQGPNVMAGYWRLPEVTAETVDGEGWLRSGDVALRDNEGFVFVVDRMKDMIISGGENIYPAEVEDALYRHPGVKECAVIGVSDARWGEVGHAFVVLHGGDVVTTDELEAHMRSQLAGYKVPKSYQVVEHLPRNASGKLVKHRLREQVVPVVRGGLPS